MSGDKTETEYQYFFDTVYKTEEDAEKALTEYEKKGVKPHRYCVVLERQGGWVIEKTNIGEEPIYICINMDAVFGK
jgi:hypothetical protein